MITILRAWYQRHFSNPQVVILALLLVIGFAVVLFAGRILAPILASVIIAYLLEGAVQVLERRGMPRIASVTLVFVVFLAAFILSMLGLMPVLSQQITQLVRELPTMIAEGQKQLLLLPERYPQFVSEEQVREVMGAIRAEVTALGQKVVTLSLASLVRLVTFLVYLVVIPLMVFFLLKDKDQIVAWVQSFLPSDRGLANEVWAEVNVKIGSYVRGKFMEILIVWVTSYVTFALLGLEYAMLLSFTVGISVIIPYIGAAVVTLPVAAVAYFQWGLDGNFVYVLIAYGVIQFLDGNVLVPLLFSEVVNLHPVAIITAVLVFGGLWGLWGVFFAIPLATLIQAVIKSWPRYGAAPASG
ncbi:MAG: AI-2E family transporter [Chromatiales bacterium]|jgi:putative permease|nr:AI-2E family transporter [Chromatiales bacterium]MDX9765830.1 AI-2E family transporter [Ectothiorhodospiraceae bacterium]